LWGEKTGGVVDRRTAVKIGALVDRADQRKISEQKEGGGLGKEFVRGAKILSSLEAKEGGPHGHWYRKDLQKINKKQKWGPGIRNQS